MEAQIYDVFLMAARTMYIFVLPFVLLLVGCGILSSIFQAAFSINEPAISYALKVLSLIFLIYMFLPSASQHMLSLATFAFR